MDSFPIEYSTLFKYNPIPNWVYDIETYKIIDVNDAAIAHYGYSRKEFLKLSIVDIRSAEEIKKLPKIQEDIRNKEGNIHFGVLTHKKKNGEFIRADVYGHKIEYRGFQALMVSCIDVTEKERRLEEIQQSESKLKEATEIANLGYWRLDYETNKLTWSDEVYKIWGVNPNKFEVSFDSFFKTIHPEDIEEFNRANDDAISGKRELNFVHRIYRPDKSIRWVRERGRLKYDESGKIIIFSGTVQDITAQKEEEQHLKMLESVVTNTNDAVIITEANPLDSPGPKIVYVNQAFTELTGYLPSEVIGKTPRILQGPKSDEVGLKALGKAIRKNESFELTTINYKKNKEEFWVNFKVSPVFNEKGITTHFISIERDVTLKKREELEKDLFNKISQYFNFEYDLNKTIEFVCKEIAEFGDFSIIEIWMPNILNTQLKLEYYHNTDKNGKLFYADKNQITTFNFGEGLPGTVWKNRNAVVWENVSENKLFIRRKNAKQAKIKTVIGIPLHHLGNMVGVLVVGALKKQSEIENYKNILSKIETFLGSEISRKKLESDYENLFTSIPDLILLLDSNGKILKINPAGCKLLEFTQSKLINKYFEDFAHPFDKDTLKNELNKIGEKKNIFNFKSRLIARSGRVIWLNWSCNFNKNDNVIFATAKDITNEKSLSELLDESSRFARIGSWEFNLLNNSMYWSDMVHQIHETDAENFTPDFYNAIKYYRIDFRDKISQILQNAIDNGSPFQFEAVITTEKGNSLWVRVIGQTEKHNGDVVRIFGSIQDIQKEKETEIRLKSITDDIPGVSYQYIAYPDGTEAVRSVSKGAQQIWGFAPEECEKNIGLIWDRIKEGGDFERTTKEVEDAINNMSNWHTRFRYLYPDGSIRWLEGYGTPYSMPDDTVIFNSVIFDITEEKLAKVLYEKTSTLAAIGSWELYTENNPNGEMFWSPIVKQIFEVEPEFEATLNNGLQFYEDKNRQTIEKVLENLIQNETPFDLEIQIKTARGNIKWVRCIGDGEFINDKCVRIYGSFQDIHNKKSTELRLGEILESISDAFYALDSSWKFTYFNKEAENLLNKKSEDVIGKSIWDVFPATNNTELQKTYYRVAQTGENESFEYLYPGNGFWYEVNAYFAQNGVSVYFKNIDERKHTEEQLKKASEERKEILESIGDAFFAVDNNWIVTYWNHMAEKVLMKKRTDILGKHLWTEYADAIDSDFYRMYHKAKKTGQKLSFEEHYPAVHKWFEVTAYPSEKGLSVYFKDISLRREADIQIREANQRFEKVTEATNEVIWDWNIVENTLYWGAGYKAYFGYESNKGFVSLDTWTSNLHPNDKDRVLKSLNNFLGSANGAIWDEEFRFKKSDNTYAYVKDKGIILRNNLGEPMRMVGAMKDITYQKEYEEELKKLNENLRRNIRKLELANEELEQFAFITSHDLQEPLRMITSFMDQLKRKYSEQLDDKANQYIHYASDGAKRMKRIILDLLEYSRAGRLDEYQEPISLNELLIDYKTLRRRIISEKSVQIYANDLPEITTYKVPLVQTLHCLFDNAIKYARAEVRPEIEFTVNEKDNEWLFCVKDNGIGIDERYFDKIFVIFQRLHNRDEYDGTGLGLAIVKKHVESWGGQIWLESEINKGSAFYFTIKKT